MEQGKWVKGGWCFFTVWNEGKGKGWIKGEVGGPWSGKLRRDDIILHIYLIIHSLSNSFLPSTYIFFLQNSPMEIQYSFLPQTSLFRFNIPNSYKTLTFLSTLLISVH